MGNLIESTKEASKGGFQGIRKVRGLLKSLEVVDPPDGWETTKQQVQATLEDATVLEMAEGEDDFELKDGKYSFYWSYADEGKKPSANGVWMKCAVASAEALGRKPSDFIGKYVIFEKKETELFKQRDKTQPVGEDGKHPLVVISVPGFHFVEDETGDSPNIKEFIKGLVKGLNQKAALRALLQNPRTRQFPEYKAMLNDGTLAEYLGLTLVDGMFKEVDSEDSTLL